MSENVIDRHHRLIKELDPLLAKIKDGTANLDELRSALLLTIKLSGFDEPGRP